jgi:RNA polymerase-binding transcription factor DksA
VPNEERSRILTAIETELAEVELALGRLDSGSYDRCEMCDHPLDDEALAASPTRRWCSSCRPSGPVEV